MDENERESELTDLTDSVGWRCSSLSIPLSTHVFLSCCWWSGRTDERPWFDAEYIFIQLHRLKRRKGEGERASEQVRDREEAGGADADGEIGEEDEEGGDGGEMRWGTVIFTPCELA